MTTLEDYYFYINHRPAGYHYGSFNTRRLFIRIVTILMTKLPVFTIYISALISKCLYNYNQYKPMTGCLCYRYRCVIVCIDDNRCNPIPGR